MSSTKTRGFQVLTPLGQIGFALPGHSWVLVGRQTDPEAIQGQLRMTSINPYHRLNIRHCPIN